MALVNKHCNRTYEMLVLGALAAGPVYRRSQKQLKVVWTPINWPMSGLDKQTLLMHVPAVGSGEAKDCPRRKPNVALSPLQYGDPAGISECSELDLPLLDRPSAPRCFHWTRAQHPPAIV